MRSRHLPAVVVFAGSIGIAILEFYLSAFFHSEILYTGGVYTGLIGAVAFGILVPKRRDTFLCPACKAILGHRQFLQLGSEFRTQLKKRYPQGCPVCRANLFPIEVLPNEPHTNI